ncbi:MAG: hypothetical protein G01um10145_412 [Microgenomates group bacterium Gr01-1014_5]|nr:MAG: hypothetical protein G01um10145_412 [Microgenomates group bacterium Gr01-1014_5]
MKGSFVWIVLAILVIAGIGWMWYGASKPLTGEVMADLGREHVPLGTKVNYNSNPPTSGNHYADWVKKGVYSAVKEDGYLIHSLEHGYIIISYNCEVHPQSFNLIPQALAHTGEDEATGSAESTPSATISGGDWDLPECKELVAKLAGVYKKKGEDRLIVVPRPALDARIALTAWTRIDKLDDFDEERIIKFIDAFRNQGPEKTKE